VDPLFLFLNRRPKVRCLINNASNSEADTNTEELAYRHRKTSKKRKNKKHSLGFEANDRQVERRRGENTEKQDSPPVEHVFV
jgi:hypothetical protein